MILYGFRYRSNPILLHQNLDKTFIFGVAIANGMASYLGIIIGMNTYLALKN